MSQMISMQARCFFIMFFCGAGIAMFRQLFIWTQKLQGNSSAASPISEVFFWILSSLITSSFLYYSSYGAINLHGAIAFTLGAFLCYNMSEAALGP